MKIKSLAFLCFFLIFSLGHSFPFDPVPVFEGTVKINVKHIERGVVQTGSGFCIKKEEDITTILTAGHVVATPDGFYAINAWQFYPIAHPFLCDIKLIKFDIMPQGDDYSIITTDRKNNLKPIKIAKEKPKVGDILYTAGCSHGEWVSLKLSYCAAIDDKFIEFSPSPHAGDSGGALVNAKGEVVGLIVTGGERNGKARLITSIEELKP